jgi:hypothetical protein
MTTASTLPFAARSVDVPEDLQTPAVSETTPPQKWSGPARWLVLFIVSASFTGWTLGWSFRHGRLAAPAFLDDVGYFLDAVHRIADVDNGGIIQLFTGFKDSPPHSFFSTALAMCAFGIFGVHDWAPYLLDGLIVLGLLRAVDWLMGDAPLWKRVLAYGVVLCTKFPSICVLEFKPDMAWGVASAAAVIATLYRPFLNAGTARHLAVGACWGAALLIKSSTLPVTLATLVATLVLLIACEYKRDMPPIKSLRALGAMLLIALLIAAPYYIFAWKDAYSYFKFNTQGEHAKLWSINGGFWVQARFYVDGESGMFMIGWHIWVLMALALAGGIVALVRNPQLWRRIAALGIATLVTYLIPAIAATKGLTLGSAFHSMLLLLGVMGLGQVFYATAQIRFAGVATAIFAALVLGFIIPVEMRPPMWNSTDMIVTMYNNESNGVIQTIKNDANGECAYTCVTTEGIVTGYVPLQYRAFESNLPFVFGQLQPYYTPELSAPRMRLSSYVLASEAGNRDISTSEPQDLAADDVLNWIRKSGEFDEMASFPAYNGKRFFLFSNRYCGFSGCDLEPGGITPSFPADFSRLTPVVRVGLGHATRLRVLAEQASEKLLKISVYNRFPGQTMTVHMDQNSQPLLTMRLRAGNMNLYDFQTFEIPLHLTAGSHLIRLIFGKWNPDVSWPESVIYRQIKVLPNPNPSTTRPGTQPAVATDPDAQSPMP